MKIRNFPTILLLAFTVSMTSSDISAAPLWRAEVIVHHGNDFNRVIIGADRSATDGFENAWDVGAILEGNIKAYIDHPEWGRVRYFWQDIRDTTLPKEWLFQVSCPILNARLSMNWDISNVPSTVDLFITNESSGETFDMRSYSSYTFINSTNEPMTFSIAAGGYIEGEVPVDTLPPDTTITSEVPEFVNSSSLLFEYEGRDETTSEENIRFASRLDDGDWSDWSYSSSAALTGMVDGIHVFEVKAMDEAGNEDPSPAHATFKTDITPPSILLGAPEPAFLFPPNGKMVNVGISGNVSDSVSGIKFAVYQVSDEYGKYDSSGALNLLPDGSLSLTLQFEASRYGSDKDGRKYLIMVTAEDNAGNTSSENIEVIVLHDERK